jgi:dolichyl-phosphate beta-glucosyltransferase
MRISLIIPCYKESSRFPLFLQSICHLTTRYPLEIIVVDDGSPSSDFELLKNKISNQLTENIRLLHYDKNKGKGAAIQYGIDNSAGEYIGFVDADGAIPSNEVENFIQYILKNPDEDMIISSRIRILGKTVNRSLKRHLSGRVFITILNLFFSVPVYDSQSGLKIFKREKFNLIKDKISDFRWLWDTQVLILFYKSKFKMKEIPIDWSDVPGSKVNLLRDSILMFFRLFKFKQQIH